jgi:hypothetical protein
MVKRRSQARILYELASRDREDGCATVQPQGVGAEAYLNSTSQGPTPEDARKHAHIHGRSRPFMKYAGYTVISEPCELLIQRPA